MTAISKGELPQEQRKFEFTVYLNDNIIVQRFFNVIGFNKRTINSMNFKYSMDENQALLEEHMKFQTIDFMNDNEYLFTNKKYIMDSHNNDIMKIIIRQNGTQIGYRQWDADVYPSKVKQMINIREHIYNMITLIQKCLSEKNENLETTYLQYNLDV